MAKDSLGIETPLYPGNILWEPTLSDPEKILLFEIQYKCRLSKGASTESNTTMGLRLSKSPDTINSLIGSMEKKGWIKRIKDYREKTQRQIILTPQSISMITKPFINWYCERVGKFAYPPFTKKELETIVNRKDLENYLPILIQKGWIKD
jgi:DNA-binding MarR family transcriptional regulator